MTTLRQWFKGKRFDTIVFVRIHNECFAEDENKWSKVPLFKELTYKEAEAFFDIEFDSGYGGQDVPDFYAWAKDHVITVREYDGSTCLRSVPRNPPDTKKLRSWKKLFS